MTRKTAADPPHLRKSVRKRIDELRELVRYHNHRYHVLDSPELADCVATRDVVQRDETGSAVRCGARFVESYVAATSYTQ